MPKRDWCSNITIAGWGVAILLGALLFGQWVAGSFPNSHLNPFQDRPPTKEYEPDCSNPQEADLCSQWRMAKAAEDQTTLNIINVGLLFGTLFFTGWAAFAASRAARAAIRTADIAERSAAETAQFAAASADASAKSANVADRALRGLERPYLFVKITDTSQLRFPMADITPSLMYTLVNYGRTPAILRSVSITLEWKPDLPLRTPMAVAEPLYDVIAPGDALEHPRKVKVVNATPGQRYVGAEAILLVLHGLIQYQSATGEFYSERVRLQGTKGGKAFRILD